MAMPKVASEKAILPPEKVQEIKEEIDRHAVDMITATSKLQMEAQEVRVNKPNWKSYLQGQMISNDDYNFITAYESVKKMEEKNFLLDKSRLQCAKTFISLMSNISKDQTVRYVLTLIDDMLLEDRSRCEIFWAYARKQKQSVWEPFILMLGRNDGFVLNQVSRIIAKLACWSQELMDGPDLMYYLNWLKDQLRII
uniref:V-type proton ATPase subunit H n=1 Tax=Romanomermis culicivorax TaxID=13658 RepID=A0A915HW46_ROMCU